ncbi:MAG: leucine-rich repeat domain-containing protein, partial [Muribaculaceae bacterium]|nr:leucine-rich repeat domain-containing protein [Muribaculaceae bacterium]
TLTGPVDKQLTELIIPEAIEYDGTSYPVTSIGNSAFYNCQKLTKVVIPPVITSIGESTFQYCESITELTIPQSVTNIGGYAFWECSALKTLTIADGDSELSFGVSALAGCYIETLYLGRNFTKDTFSGNDLLKNLTISDSVTAIPEDAFNSCSGLTSIEIPNTVTSIGNRAFISCTALTDVTIADGDTTLEFGDYVFGETPIQTLYLGRNITGNPFASNKSIKNLTISNSVTLIPENAFDNCSGITSVEIPSSVTSIGRLAFCFCSALTDVTIADGDTTLDFGEDVFAETPIERLKLGRNYSFNSDYIPGQPFYYHPSITSITISNYVSTIPDYAFSTCSGFTSLEIPNSVTSIGMYAFQGCSKLTDLTIADGDNDLTFGENVFFETPIETLYLGRDIAESSKMPFRSLTTLKNLTIGSTVTATPMHVFSDCSALTDVTIADGDTELQFGWFAFENAPVETVYMGRNFSGTPFSTIASIKDVTISEKVTSLPDYAFSSTGITSLKIPESVISVGAFAFKNCSGLTEVIIADGDSDTSIDFSNAVFILLPSKPFT